MQTLLQDLRFALRQLRKTPGFTFVAVLTLALGMGATTAIFSIIDGALRLPFPRADRLVSVKNVYPTASYFAVSYPDFIAWRQQNKTFAQITAVANSGLIYKGAHGPVFVRLQDVSRGFFSMFGLRPLVGRTFLPTEERKGAAPVCVISEGFWKGQFDGDPSVIGRDAVIDGKSYTIVGVVPDMRPAFFRTPQVWRPLEADPPYDQHGMNYLYATGLLKPGVTMAQARSDLGVIQAQIDKQFPDNKHGIALQPLAKTFFGDLRSVMTVLFAAVGFILLIACVNLANMMLARATGRAREFGIRQALGATSWRLLRQSLTESIVLAAVGGLLGLLLAMALTRIPIQSWPGFLQAPRNVPLSADVLLFAAALVILTSLLFGAAPAFETLRRNRTIAVPQDLRTMSHSRRQRVVRTGLMVTEIAVATLLVAGALGMALYFAKLLRTDPGVHPDHTLSLIVSLPANRYEKKTEQQRFFHTLTEALATLPGVEAAAGISAPPFSGDVDSSSYTYEGGPKSDPNHTMFADTYFVTPEYFRTMRAMLLQGRLFTQEDATNSPKVLVIGQSMATRLWPGHTAIGKHISIGLGDGSQEVVGVIADVRGEGLAAPAGDQVYLSTEQFPVSQMTMVLRTRGEPMNFAAAAVSAVHAIDPEAIVTNITPVEALAMRSIAPETTATELTGALGILALLLASVGVYGVVAYTVSRRTREFGIRMALGARRGQIVAMLLRSSAGDVALGVAAGALLALPLNRWMQSLLGHEEGFHLLAFAGTALLLAAVALLATAVPARRAASIDPMTALRTE